MKQKLYTTLLVIFSCSTLVAQDFQSYIGFGGNDSIRVYTSSDHQRPGWDETASGSKTIQGDGLDYRYMTASRFLAQATLGSEEQQIEHAALYSDDFEDWIDEQISIPASSMLERINQIHEDVNVWLLQQGADSSELSDRPSWQRFNYAWWNINMTNEDLLRQRIAYALSQILVISHNSDLEAHGRGTSDYYDIFINHAFGNFRDIIEDVSLHPTMGYYLSHLNNPRSIPEENIHPDENYAREIMQLFTIGLYELNIDGSRKQDANGDDIPTYTQADITELAKVFTGLSVSAVMPNMYIDEAEFGVGIYLGLLTEPMAMYEDWHEPGQKTILGGQIIPNGQSGMEDIKDALDILFNHPNVGPFLARRLIQQLIKSNPTPEYIGRVASAFNNNGNGVRGDMEAVFKAILLDNEARNCSELLEANHGKLTEPFLRYTRFARFVEKENFYNRIWNIGYNFYNATTQSPLLSPTVFNFYLPDFQPNGGISNADLNGPEFQIHNSKTSIAYMNQANNMAVWTYLMDDWEENSPAVYIDYAKMEPLAKDPEVLLNYLDKHFTQGMMSAETRTIIKESLMPIVNGDYRFDRVRLATYLTLISPDYAILR